MNSDIEINSTFFWNMVKLRSAKTWIGRLSESGQKPCESGTHKCRIKEMNSVPSTRWLRKDCQKCLKYSEQKRSRSSKEKLKTHFCEAKNTPHKLSSPGQQGKSFYVQIRSARSYTVSQQTIIWSEWLPNHQI